MSLSFTFPAAKEPEDRSSGRECMHDFLRRWSAARGRASYSKLSGSSEDDPVPVGRFRRERQNDLLTNLHDADNTMRLPPIYYYCFHRPLSYTHGLNLQERVHQLQLLARKTSGNHRDFLFLLEHRPVYTFGRRQGSDTEGAAEMLRLRATGADVVLTLRGGQTT